jgi:hypothetical protein
LGSLTGVQAKGADIMEDKLCFRNSDDLKIQMKRSVSFPQKEDPPESPLKAKGENTQNQGDPSKYRKILCCSFVNENTVDTCGQRVGVGRG